MLGEKKYIYIYIYIDIYAIGSSLGSAGRGSARGRGLTTPSGILTAGVHTIVRITVDVPALYGYCAAL